MSTTIKPTVKSGITPDTDIIVVGGGLAGLTTATLLIDAGHRVLLLEARHQTGGRIRSVRGSHSGAYLADLGPTWVWPAYQPVVHKWLERLSLSVTPQYDRGQAIVEMSDKVAPIAAYLPGQDGSVRIDGGSQALIDVLTANLPPEVVRTGALVTNIAARPDGVTVGFSGLKLSARQIVVCIPPRIAAATLNWQPDLSGKLRRDLMALPTWMASHAKAVIRFEAPFWRKRALSGRIMSRVGPLVEVHDHSAPDGTSAALFGFIGWPHEVRAKLGDELKDQIVGQLTRCFGAKASTPIDIRIKDWAKDPLVAVPMDLDHLGGHPQAGSDLVRQMHFDGKISFAVAETAVHSAGLIEGALIAAEHVAMLIGPKG